MGHVRADGHAALAEAARSPALGLPALTFRAWFEAQYGRDAWDALYKIPRTQWMDYLRWYRRVLDLQVRNDTTLVALRPRDDGLLALDAATAKRRRCSRGTWCSPPAATGFGALRTAARARAAHARCHSSEPIDFAALAGKRVGVVGAGASAFDNAGTALEAGAARVDLFFRRTDIPRINKLTGIGSPGLRAWVRDLDDATKWRFMHYALIVARRRRATACCACRVTNTRTFMQPDRDARGTCGRTRRRRRADATRSTS